ncbi:hypothetical protein, partial [Escherichia coli]|uniref:hypothetical protein n=1 Tax=Escherichia coli TaxID=562 RepID=UPI00292FA907
ILSKTAIGVSYHPKITQQSPKNHQLAITRRLGNRARFNPKIVKILPYHLYFLPPKKHGRNTAKKPCF